MKYCNFRITCTEILSLAQKQFRPIFRPFHSHSDQMTLRELQSQREDAAEQTKHPLGHKTEFISATSAVFYTKGLTCVF